MNSPSLRSIVVAYEDQYCDALHLFLKNLRRDHGAAGIVLEARPVGGTGNFTREAPKHLRLPLAQTKTPPDRVVCLGDADKPTNLTADAPVRPVEASTAALDAWILDLERTWRTSLIRGAKLSDPDAARLSTVCLRWNKESLLIACPDALVSYAQKLGGDAAVRTWLTTRCDPDPHHVLDREYTSTYRRPDQCMGDVIRQFAGRSYKKGRDDEDILKQHVIPDPQRRAQVLARCPDLARLVAELA